MEKDLLENLKSAVRRALLSGDKPEIQIHEYLALKYQFETAVATRNWWGL